MIKSITLFLLSTFLTLWTYTMAGVGACALVWAMLGTYPACGESLSLGQHILIPVMGVIVWFIHDKTKQGARSIREMIRQNDLNQ